MRLKRHLKKQRRSRIENKKGDIMALSEQELNAQKSIYNELLAEYNYLLEKKKVKEELSKPTEKQKTIFYSTLSNNSKSDKSYEDEVIEELREKKLPYVSFEELRNNKIIQMAIDSLIKDAKRNR